MKIFISHSSEDKEKTELIANILKKRGHDVWFDSWKLKVGDNFIEKINTAILDSDAIVFILSINSINSNWVKKELDSILLSEIANDKKRLYPVLIDKTPVPNYLSNYLYLDLSTDFENGLLKLVDAIETVDSKSIYEPTISRKENYDNQVSYLGSELRRGRLSLICGAGISIDAGIPPWNQLLVQLLKIVIDRLSKNNNIFDAAKPEEFSSVYSPSSLMIGKYLKNNLGDSFYKDVRDALYLNNPTSCEIIEKIVELARPQRDGKPLDSIITFNFDSLIEECFKKNKIPYYSIYSEGMRNSAFELPIFHVHGYLPRNSKIQNNCGIVFSEDAYHTQFIDPFSWSNLIQLNKLSQTTCLLVGLSLTDPNLRRLLDVANRKRSEKRMNHYIIKKVPDEGQTSIAELARYFEEQDANELGLQVIWIKNYKEIPNILENIANEK